MVEMRMKFRPGQRVRVEYDIAPGYDQKLGTVLGMTDSDPNSVTVLFDEDIPGYAAGTICPAFDSQFLVVDQHIIDEDEVA